MIQDARSHEIKMMEIVGRDREELNELQADITKYVLAEVILRSINEAWRTWWLLWCPILKILI
jgi:hypothetical protein